MNKGNHIDTQTSKWLTALSWKLAVTCQRGTNLKIDSKKLPWLLWSSSRVQRSPMLIVNSDKPSSRENLKGFDRTFVSTRCFLFVCAANRNVGSNLAITQVEGKQRKQCACAIAYVSWKYHSCAQVDSR